MSPGSLRGVAVVVLRNDDAAAVRIEQDLVRVEPQAARGSRRPVDAIAVDLSRPHAGNEHVPVVVGAVRRRIERNDAGRRGVILAVEEQQLDARRGPREQAEVDAAVDDRGAERASFGRRFAAADGHWRPSDGRWLDAVRDRRRSERRTRRDGFGVLDCSSTLDVVPFRGGAGVPAGSFAPHFQPLIAGMSSPYLSMYSLCSISFSWIACLK